MTVFTPGIQTRWSALCPFFVIRNEAEYDQAVEHLNELLDEIGADENLPLYEMLDTLGTIIHAYEEQNEPIPDVSGREVLQFLLE